MYDADYVNKLYAMVRRNLQGDFRFVCFTDDPANIRSEVETLPLPSFPEPPWKYARFCQAWRKLALFDVSETGVSGRTLFLDLDLVILRSIDSLFDGDAPFMMLENWFKPGKGQASVMRFDDNVGQPLLDSYLEDPLSVLESYRTEQEFISTSLCHSTDAFFDRHLCVSFKKHVMFHDYRKFVSKDYSAPQKASIIVFHGRPNPPDAIRGEWGKPMSAMKRWWKGLRPCPWIADYWRE